jgi:hypothetical protein
LTQTTAIFVHIPKTAGTTLARIAERHYPARARLHLEHHDQSVRAFQALSKTRRAEIRFLRGHIPFGLHQHCPRPATYFTLLRHPIDRMISYYGFVQREPPHYLHDYANQPGMTLKRYVEDRVSLQMDNMQTRLLSGVWTDPGYGECDQATLDLAKRNLDRHFDVVGITERFDESLLLLKRALGWRNIHYVRHNVSSGRPRSDSLDAETLSVLHKCNQLDLELYRHAQARLADQLRAYGPTLSQDLRSFRFTNRLVQPFGRVYWQARRISLRAWLKARVAR